VEKELLFTLNFDSLVTREEKESLLVKFIDEFIERNGFSAGGNLEGMGIFGYQGSISYEELQMSVEGFFKKNSSVSFIEYQRYNNSNDSFNSYKKVAL